jgi:hypothetical protein
VEEQQNDNEYRKIIALQIGKNELIIDQKCEAQLDTASPISLIKVKFVPLILVSKTADNHYEGINSSTLEILGGVKARIFMDDLSTDGAIFRVVPDSTIKCDAILGRDALKLLGLTLAKRIDERREDNIVSEILNIEPIVSDGDEIDNLNINTEIPSNVRNEFMSRFRTAYLQAEKPTEPKIKAEIKLFVKDKQPFHFASGRLSYEEKNRLQEIIDDLLVRKINGPEIPNMRPG